jgi:hypothetical protein
MMQSGGAIGDAGTVVFHDNQMENCGTAGVVIGGGNALTMHDNIIQNSTACLFYSAPCDQQSIRNNHFFRDEAADGYFVETIYYFPLGPFDIDLSGNYWGTTDLDDLRLWTLDGHDFDNVGMYMVFDPVADGPVHTERMNWSGVKSLYR